MITRRKIVIALGATALASSLSSFAQPAAKVWRKASKIPNSILVQTTKIIE